MSIQITYIVEIVCYGIRAVKVVATIGSVSQQDIVNNY